jgi:hypothetical protein
VERGGGAGVWSWSSLSAAAMKRGAIGGNTGAAAAATGRGAIGGGGGQPIGGGSEGIWLGARFRARRASATRG